MVSVVMSTVMTWGGHAGRAAEGRDCVTSKSRASRASKNLLICSTVHLRSQDTDRYSPMAHTWEGTAAQPHDSAPCRKRAGVRRPPYHRREHVPAAVGAAQAAHELQQLLCLLHHQRRPPRAQRQELGAQHPAGEDTCGPCWRLSEPSQEEAGKPRSWRPCRSLQEPTAPQGGGCGGGGTAGGGSEQRPEKRLGWGRGEGPAATAGTWGPNAARDQVCSGHSPGSVDPSGGTVGPPEGKVPTCARGLGTQGPRRACRFSPGAAGPVGWSGSHQQTGDKRQTRS